ncbi:MAG: PTS IIA-like nitrogen regulatory protein PtsN [Gammaproteobacteria bacterium]|nr:PTS IIA-like nitrogen regulatory protein PtsN [Gammaproteobacteria bacterium]
MSIAQIVEKDRLQIDAEASSKKRALERLSELMATGVADTSAGKVFDSLLVRERLGSTGFGNGVAIPHARHPGATSAVGAFMRLAAPVDFDAMDSEPVDLVFGLLVPEESTQEHVELLGELAELFEDKTLRESLRNASDTDEVFTLLTSAAPHT